MLGVHVREFCKLYDFEEDIRQLIARICFTFLRPSRLLKSFSQAFDSTGGTTNLQSSQSLPISTRIQSFACGAIPQLLLMAEWPSVLGLPLQCLSQRCDGSEVVELEQWERNNTYKDFPSNAGTN